MTKEELKKEAEEKADIYCDRLEVNGGNVSDTRFSDYDVFVAYEKGALDFAEPREKQIQALGERCLQLQKDKGNLTDRVNELEAQIEEMKCCYNCANDTLEPPEVIGNGICEHCKNHDKWELAD